MKNIKYDFTGKNVVITGGAQGIGLEIVQRFQSAGAQVNIWDYSEDGLKAVEKVFTSTSAVRLQQVNVADWDSCVQAAAALKAPVDILVNNAGITRDKSFAKMDTAEFQSVIDTNLTGLFNVTKSLLDKFSPGTEQRIINMASIVALYGNFGQTNYVAAKAGVIGMTKTWARELGRKGFTVNAIAPGFIRTAMTEKMPADVLNTIAEKIPVRRLGLTADIAAACLFLASAEAGYINGTVISVDGGLIQ